MELDADANGGSYVVHLPTLLVWMLARCDDVELAAHALEVRDGLRQQVAAPAVDSSRPLDPPGLRAWSPVDAMRGRPRFFFPLSSLCHKRAILQTSFVT